MPITNPHGGILVADNQHRCASVVVQEKPGNLGNLSLSGSRPASGGHSSHPYRSWFCGSASWARLGWVRTHSSSQRPPASPCRQGPASQPPADRPGRVPRGSSVPETVTPGVTPAGREEDTRLLEDGAQEGDEDNPPRPVSHHRPPAQPRCTVRSHRAALVERALQTDLRRAIFQSATKAINKGRPRASRLGRAAERVEGRAQLGALFTPQFTTLAREEVVLPDILAYRPRTEATASGVDFCFMYLFFSFTYL